jgi:uncharacterized protein
MFDKVNSDLVASMKAQDKFKTSVLRMLKASIMNEKIAKQRDLTDDEVLNVIKKNVKMRKDAKDEYEKYSRNDLALNLSKEIDILNTYLPKELSEDELSKIIDDLIMELKPDGLKGMGMIIKAVSAKCGTAADMGLVSKLVKEKLMNL